MKTRICTVIALIIVLAGTTVLYAATVSPYKTEDSAVFITSLGGSPELLYFSVTNSLPMADLTSGTLTIKNQSSQLSVYQYRGRFDAHNSISYEGVSINSPSAALKKDYGTGSLWSAYCDASRPNLTTTSSPTTVGYKVTVDCKMGWYSTPTTLSASISWK